jgi:predicted nucleic acid-binding protein
VIYVDTSAFVKLIWREAETPALERYLIERADDGLVSSALLAIEVRRTVLREQPSGLPRADLLLTRVGQVGITGAVVESASRLTDPFLRSLDAIHVATALMLGRDIEVLLSYDKRVCAAAQAHRIGTVSPAAQG